MAEREAYACSREENDGGGGGEDKEAGEEGGDTRGFRPGGGMPREHPRVDVLQPVPQGMKAWRLPAAKRVGGAGEFVQRQQRFTQLPVQGGVEGREVCVPARFSIRRASPATPFLPLPFWMRSRCSIAIQSA